MHVERSPPRFKAPAHPLSSQSRSRRKRRLHHRPAPENPEASLRSANHPRLKPLPLPESGLVISVLRQAPPLLRGTGSHLPRRGPLREQLAQENKGAYLPRPEPRLVLGDPPFRIPGLFRSGKGPRLSRLGTLREPPVQKKPRAYLPRPGQRLFLGDPPYRLPGHLPSTPIQRPTATVRTPGATTSPGVPTPPAHAPPAVRTCRTVTPNFFFPPAPVLFFAFICACIASEVWSAVGSALTCLLRPVDAPGPTGVSGAAAASPVTAASDDASPRSRIFQGLPGDTLTVFVDRFNVAGFASWDQLSVFLNAHHRSQVS